MMPQVWDADVDVSIEHCSELIKTQFPEIGARDIRLIGEGYDNAAYLVNEHWLFRFPRRKIAEKLIMNECRALRVLAPHLPLRVPVPVYIGVPSDGYPYPFAGYQFLGGTSANQLAWTDEDRAKNADTLGRFFAALHSVPVSEETRTWAAEDDIKRSNLLHRLGMIAERLKISPGIFADFDARRILEVAAELSATPGWDKPTVWVHGDAHLAHLLVNNDHFVTAVIDWGDVHLGDPALDISIAFAFLPPTAREEFRQSYGGVDDATWNRARFRALFYGILLTYYGCETANEPFRMAGEYALRAASQ